MASKNDITGDKIQTKGILSKEGEANWNKIFGKKKKDDTRLSEQPVADMQSVEDEIDVKRLTDAFNGL